MIELSNVKQEMIIVENCENDSVQSGQFCFVSCGTDSGECLETTEEIGNKQEQGVQSLSSSLDTLTCDDITVNRGTIITVCDLLRNTVMKYTVKHGLSHSDIRPYQCNVCNKTFPHSKALLSHKVIHSSIKKYTCDVCSRSFAHSSTLSQHKLIHYGIKKYRCNICNKSFTKSNTLKCHRVVHTGEKNFHCDMCHKNFGHSRTLQRHKLIHTRKKKDVNSV